MYDLSADINNTIFGKYDTIIFDLDQTIWNCFTAGGTSIRAFQTTAPYSLLDADTIVDIQNNVIRLQPGAREVFKVLNTESKKIGICSTGEKLSDLTSKTPIPFQAQPSAMLLHKFDLFKYLNYDVILKAFIRKEEYLRPSGKTLFIDDKREIIDTVKEKRIVDVLWRGSFNSWSQLLQPLTVASSLQKLAENKSTNPRLGHCYYFSYQYVSSNPEFNLIHGYITSREGNTIDHAWCERGSEVYDPVLDLLLPQDAYYRMLNAEKDKEYTQEEMYKKALKAKTYGPWHEITREIKPTPPKRATSSMVGELPAVATHKVNHNKYFIHSVHQAPHTNLLYAKVSKVGEVLPSQEPYFEIWNFNKDDYKLTSMGSMFDFNNTTVESNLKFSTLYFYPNVELEPEEYQEVLNFLKNEGSEISETTFNKFQFLPNFEELKEHFDLQRWHTIWENVVNNDIGKKFVNNVLHSQTQQFEHINVSKRSEILKHVPDYSAYSYILSGNLGNRDLEILTMNPNLSDKTLSVLLPKVVYNQAAINRIKTHPNAGEITKVILNQSKSKKVSLVDYPESGQLSRVRAVNCSAAALRELSGSTYEKVRQAVATHHNTPADTLENLSKDPSQGVRIHVASNKNTPPLTLEELGKDSWKLVRSLVAGNNSTPLNTLRMLSADSEEDVRNAVALNKNTPVDVYESLSNDSSAVVRMWIAEKSDLPIDILRRLSVDEDARARGGVARNQNTPADVFDRLADDDDNNDTVTTFMLNNKKLPASTIVKIYNRPAVTSGTVGRIALHPNTPLEVLLDILKKPGYNADGEAARNPNMPVSLLESMLPNLSTNVKRALAGRDDVSSETLLALSKDIADYVRATVARNKNTPVEALEILSKDPEQSVSRDATKTLLFLSRFPGNGLTKSEMKSKGYKGTESFDHKAVSLPYKNYMYDLGVSGQDWTRLIYASDNDIPQELFQAFNLHGKDTNAKTGHDKFLGWIGGKYNPATKSLYVTEMQSDLLQRTFELRNRVFVSKGYDKYKSKLENMFDGWQKVFFNQALREAKEKGANFVYVPTAAFYKTKHKNAPVQYYNQIVQDYPHTTEGNWHVIDMNQDLRIASLRDSLSFEYFDSTPSSMAVPEDVNFSNPLTDTDLRRTNLKRYDERGDWYTQKDSEVSNRQNHDQTSIASVIDLPGGEQYDSYLTTYDVQPAEIIKNTPSRKVEEANPVRNQLNFTVDKLQYEKGLHSDINNINTLRPITPYASSVSHSKLQQNLMFAFATSELTYTTKSDIDEGSSDSDILFRNTKLFDKPKDGFDGEDASYNFMPINNIQTFD